MRAGESVRDDDTQTRLHAVKRCAYNAAYKKSSKMCACIHMGRQHCQHRHLTSSHSRPRSRALTRCMVQYQQQQQQGPGHALRSTRAAIMLPSKASRVLRVVS
jgi:hypothetical protein